MEFLNVEILGNGGGNMKDKLNKLMEKNGFIMLLFILVLIIAGGTIYLSMKLDKEQNMGKEDFVILDDAIKTENSTEIKEDLEKDVANVNEQQETQGNIEETAVTMEDVEDAVDTEDMGNAENIQQEISDVELGEAVEVSSKLEDEIEFEDDIEDTEDVNFVEKQKERKLILPVDGSIITEYTSDKLVYSETLEAWIGHGGIDIKAEIGTPVKAALDGVVKEVYEDDLWGIVIVIDHGNQLETRYANLSTKEMVKVGAQVKQGDHISKVGDTAKIEMLMEPHLHFEVLKDGKLVDPRSITK